MAKHQLIWMLNIVVKNKILFCLYVSETLCHFSETRVRKIEFDELDFLSSLNLIFAGYTGSKNQVHQT